MTPATAYFLGIFSGFMIVSITAWWAVTWFRDDPFRALDLLAGMLRIVDEKGRFHSALVELGDGPTVVPFGTIADAIEGRSLLAHTPVRVTRSDRPPPRPVVPGRYRTADEDPPDGSA